MTYKNYTIRVMRGQYRFINFTSRIQFAVIGTVFTAFDELLPYPRRRRYSTQLRFTVKYHSKLHYTLIYLLSFFVLISVLYCIGFIPQIYGPCHLKVTKAIQIGTTAVLVG